MSADRRTLPVCVESPMVIEVCGNTLGFSQLTLERQVKMFEFAHTFINFLMNKSDKMSAQRVRDVVKNDFSDEEKPTAILIAVNILNQHDFELG